VKVQIEQHGELDLELGCLASENNFNLKFRNFPRKNRNDHMFETTPDLRNFNGKTVNVQ